MLGGSFAFRCSLGRGERAGLVARTAPKFVTVTLPAGEGSRWEPHSGDASSRLRDRGMSPVLGVCRGPHASRRGLSVRIPETLAQRALSGAHAALRRLRMRTKNDTPGAGIPAPEPVDRQL